MTFDEFTRLRLPGLARFAAMICVDRGLAEDVVQEVLLRVHGRWAEIDRLAHPDAYVRRMIVNEYLSWKRKWARVVPTEIVPEDGVGADPFDQLGDRAQLAAEIARLPRRQRVVVVLRFYGGLTDAEIAADLGCSQGTVRSHMSRALATLRVQLDVPSEVEESDERLTH